MPADKQLNAFDAEGVEESLGESATRVSAIWISYLLFGLYLLVTAGTATNNSFLLAEPVKLPAPGTDVPLISAAMPIADAASPIRKARNWRGAGSG